MRKVASGNLPVVYKIEYETFRDPYPSFFIDFLAKQNPEIFLVAKDKGEIVRYIVVSIEKEICHLVSLAVRRDHLRRAIGSSLVTKILEILKRSGASSVRLEVRKSNVAAQKFYKKLGFNFVRVDRSYYGRRRCLHIREKALRTASISVSLPHSIEFKFISVCRALAIYVAELLPIRFQL